MEIKNKIKLIQENLKSKKFKEVINDCKNILKKDPDNIFVLNLCGMAIQKVNIEESIPYFLKIIKIDKNNLAALNNLANTYKSLNKLGLAEEIYIKITRIDPNYIQAIYNYGNLKQQINDYKNAINLYRKALELDKKNIRILFSLAISLQSIGNFDEAKKFLNEILKIQPNNSSAHRIMSGILIYKSEEDKHFKDLKEISNYKEKELTDEEKIDFNFSLGKAYEDIGNYEKSYFYLERGNKLKKNKTNFNIKKETNFFKNIKNIFNNININDLNLQKKTNNNEIIFICGMPRSGTTLIEQIISSHKNVYGAGELFNLQKSVENNLQENNILSKSKILNHYKKNINIVQNDYFKMLKFYNYKDKKITDKTPHNFRWIGLIKIFFPNCKVIHCTRDPKDTCLSLYKINFESNMMNWSYDQNDIAEYFNLYNDLMNFWEKKLGNFIFEANYEKIVNNKEEEIKKLITFCDLDWDSNCLNFYNQNKTPINTASVNQARKEIYRSSIKSSEGYSKYLSNLFNSLKLNS